MLGRLLLVLLVLLIGVLTPAALASPPDPHWRGGLYDNADHDEVVMSIVESLASLPLVPTLPSGESAVGRTQPFPEASRATATRVSDVSRAPPPLRRSTISHR